MLQGMRKHAKYFYVLFFIVILSFIFWGVGGLDKPTSVSVAEIGKEKITVEEYWRAYERMRTTYREMFKAQFDEEMEKKLRLKETVLDGLIEERVLLATAKTLGITVTDKELQEAITSDPRFIRDGVFKKDIYFKTLQLNRLTPELYENMMRQDRMLQKMRRLVWSAADIDPADLKDLSGDETAIKQKKQMLLFTARNAALKSYVDSMKKKLDVKINKDVLS